jgi:hypothetical protein
MNAAAGAGGCFGQNDHILKLESPASKLSAMGESIGELRRDLGISEAFQPHERFLHTIEAFAGRTCRVSQNWRKR